MKKALLILLMLLLPWQAYAAMERNLVHVLGDGTAHSMTFVAQHLAEHAAHVPHHHDEDDGDGDGDGAPAAAPHQDDSPKSLQHLADYDHGCGLYILLPAYSALALTTAARTPPLVHPETFSDRTTLPLLRPPRSRA